MQGIDIRLRWSCSRANGGGDAYRDEDANFARRQAFGLVDIDSSTHYVEHAAKTLFLMWVTLTEHKWVTLGERGGSRGAGISWPLRRSEARRSSTWHSVPTATGRGLGWSWWWRRTYALNSGCCPEEHGVQVLPSPGAKAPFLSRFGTAEAMP